jgi:phytoene dehydrogenase-like protein
MGKTLVIGGGHNGLAAAVVQGMAGRDVTVLEARSQLGGLAASHEFAEGYWTPGILHDSGTFRTEVAKTLKLENHGLRFRHEATTYTAVMEGEDAIQICGDTLSGPVEAGEQARYTALQDFIRRLSKVIRGLTSRPPLDPTGSLWPLMKTGAQLRRLGAHDMTEFLRIGPMCVADWMRDVLGDERMRAFTAFPSLMGAWMGPWSPWSSVNLILSACVRGNEVEGGSPAVVAALRDAAQAHGVQLRTQARVSQILLEGSKAVGVRLETGEELRADCVLSSIDPKGTFQRLIPAVNQSASLAQAIRRYRTRGITAKCHLALNGPLALADGTEVEALRTGASLDGLERAYDAVKYRENSARPVLDVRVPSMLGEGFAPEGHHVASILIKCAPYDLKGGWGEENRAQLQTRVLDELSRHCPGVRDQLVGHELLAPPDLETRFGLTEGHLYHGEHAPDQLLFLRPVAELSEYTTPIDGLVLCGAGCHPGGGISGMPGVLGGRAAL